MRLVNRKIGRLGGGLVGTDASGGGNGGTPLGRNLGALATRTDDRLPGRTQQFVLSR